MVPLGPAAGVLRAGFPGQRVQHRLQRGGAPAGQLPVQLPGAAQGGAQPQRPVLEPVTGAGVGAGGAAADLLGQPGQAVQVRAAGRRGQQDHVRVPPALFGQQIGPAGDLPRPRHGDRAAGQGGGDRGMISQRPHRRQRGAGRRAGDPRLPPQPRPRRSLPVILIPALRRERAQHPGPRRGMNRQHPLQPPQAIRLHPGRNRRHISAGQPAQASQHHLHRRTRRRRNTRWQWSGRRRDRPVAGRARRIRAAGDSAGGGRRIAGLRRRSRG